MTLKFSRSVGLCLFVYASSAGATEYFVRTDGNDACNGRLNTAGASGDCAFRTVGRCELAAGCGDTCRVAAGDFYEQGGIEIRDACTSAAPKRFIGGGRDQTRLFGGLTPPLSCSPKSGETNVFVCPMPSGALRTSSSAQACMVQTPAAPVFLSDENGVKGHLRDYVCLTPASSYTSIDTNEDGRSDSSLSAAAAQGLWHADAGSSSYNIHLWNNEVPSSSVRLHAPTAEALESQVVFYLTPEARFVTIEGMTIVTGSGVGVRVQGSHDVTVQGVDIFTGSLMFDEGASRYTVRDVRVKNNYRRAVGRACGSRTMPCSSGWTSSGTAIFRGTNFLIDGFEGYGAREGVSFTSNSSNGTIRNFKTHFHHNHGFKLIDDPHDLRFENCFSYNSQEAVYLMDCAANISFRHCTFDGTFFVLGKYYEGACSSGKSGPSNIEIYNSQIGKVSFANDAFGDPRRGGGFRMDYNVFRSNPAVTVRCDNEGNGDIRDDPIQSLSVSSWQSYSCPTDCRGGGCVRDPHSKASTAAAEFLNPKSQDSSIGYSFDLKTGAVGIGMGSPDYAPANGKDLDLVTRVGNPDVGGWEYESDVTSSVCGNGVKEAGEDCDSTDLGGATCQSLGFESGTLSCVDCIYRTAACVMPSDAQLQPPAGFDRGDRKE